MKHREISALAVRLTCGAVVDVTDEHGRRWRATRDALTLEPWGAPVLLGDAFDVAAELVRRTRRAAS